MYKGPELDVRNRSMLGAVCVLKGSTLEGDLDTQPIAVGQAEHGKCHDKDKDVPWCCENNPAVPPNSKHKSHHVTRQFHSQVYTQEN